MQRKYLMIVISIIVTMLIGIGIISIPSLIEAKSRYEYSLFLENVNKAFEEMVVFCEENQKEIEAYSIRHLDMVQPDMSNEEFMKMEKQIIEELDCKWMFEKISVCYSRDLEEIEEIVKYTDKNFFSYIDSDGVQDYHEIEIFYFEKEISQQDFEEGLPSFVDGPCILEDIKKINAHLYVCVTGYECV